MCNCGGGGPSGIATQYEVRLPNGEVKIVDNEAAARIEITAAGGGDYKKK